LNARLTAVVTACVLGLSLGGHPASAAPLSFRWISPCEEIARICEKRILASGDIEWDSAAKLRAFIQDAQSRSGVSRWRGVELCFDSPGGDLEGALRLGEAIRSLAMDTCAESQYVELLANGSAAGTATIVVSTRPICASACVFALAGGVHRAVSKTARIGMHRFAGENQELGESRAQLTMTRIAQYLERNGVQRRLLDSAAEVPNSKMRYLTPREIADTNLDNTTQVYEDWKLHVWQDGTVYAHVEQRNPLTDHWTGLALYQRGNLVCLNVVVQLLSGAPLLSAGDDAAPSPETVLSALAAADIWMRLDEEDFIDFGKAPWIYGPDRAFMRKLQIPKSKLKALQTANMLEVWITAPQLNQHLNPSMAFRLESLRPLVRALLKISDR